MIQNQSVDIIGGIKSSRPKCVQSGEECKPDSNNGWCSFSQRMPIWIIVLDEEICLSEGFESHLVLLKDLILLWKYYKVIILKLDWVSSNMLMKEWVVK